MRKLALLLFFGACGSGAPAPAPQFLAGLDKAVRIHCTPFVSETLGFRVSEIKTENDHLLVTYQEERRVVILDDSLHVRRLFQFDKEGPRGVRLPASAAIQDSVLYVVDRPLPRLKRFTLAGVPLEDLRLQFSPVRIAAVRDELAIIPMVYGRYPESLLFSYAHDRIVSLQVRPVDYPDLTLKMLANIQATAVLDAELLMMHQFMVPRGYRWRPGSAPIAVGALLPQEVRKSVGYVPPLPLDEQAMKPVLAVAIDVAADKAGKRFVILTRSGRQLGSHSEKVLIRTTPDLRFTDAFLLPVNAGHLALVDSGRTAVVIDEEDAWFTCPLQQTR